MSNYDINYINCKSIAQEIKHEIKEGVNGFVEKYGRNPYLAIFSVGDDPASKSYIKGKIKDCDECGIEVILTDSYPHGYENVHLLEDELCKRIQDAARIGSIDGIIVQLPLPDGMNKSRIISCIPPNKDVDCFSRENVAKLYLGEPGLKPCTPAACIELLDRINYDLTGKVVTVIGRSDLVGKPLAAMLTQRNATVTLCHSKTQNLILHCLDSDVIITAMGNPNVFKYSMIPTGSIVLDVGINRDENGKICGDIKHSEVIDLFLTKAKAVTPVPGGIGLMTRVMLLKNVLEAANNNMKVKEDE